MDNEKKEKNIFYLFEGSMLFKGLHAIIEIIGGVLAFFVTQNFITNTVLKITHGELSEDPHDYIVNYLIHASQSFSISSKYFVAFYLLSHGVVNGVLVVFLLKKKWWAYPASLVIFGIFMLYQIMRYQRTHSVWLLLFTVFDLVVMWLVWHEYTTRNTRDATFG